LYGNKIKQGQQNMKTQTSLPKYLIITALLIGAAIGMAGCADYVGVDVAHAGYDAAYYTPDYQSSYATYYAAGYQPSYAAYYTAGYQPVYTDYYYGGAPWWGASYYYGGNKIVVKDVDKYVNVNRNVYSRERHFVPRGVGRGRAIATTHPAMTRAAMRPAIAASATTRAAIAHPASAHRRVAPVRR
jgi:hypothetical protein